MRLRGSVPLTVSSRTSALNFSRRSPSFGWRTAPVTASPLRRPFLRTWAERDVDVVRAGQVAGGAHERVVVEDVEDAGDRDQDVVLGDHRLGFVAEALAGARGCLGGVAVTAAPPAAAAAVVVVVEVTALGLLPWLP